MRKGTSLPGYNANDYEGCLVCFLDPAYGADLELRVRNLVGYGAQITATLLVVEVCKIVKGNLWQIVSMVHLSLMRPVDAI